MGLSASPTRARALGHCTGGSRASRRSLRRARLGIIRPRLSRLAWTHSKGVRMQTTASGQTEGLAREAIGLREVLFQSITHMAPAAAVAFSIVGGIAFAGCATALAVVIAIVACLMVAISIGQLAKHLPSAGSFYTYVSQGLHPSIGFLVG